uniref:GRF-type domain-containing protein n=2 Tax=Noccaea caerulescens TaxID=107243 RepID=A0A1J3IYL7_NOCCA
MEKDLDLPLQQPSSYAPAIPSTKCDDKFLEIVIQVMDALGPPPRQPPAAPAIPSARRRLAGRKRYQGKKIETRSTNDLHKGSVLVSHSEDSEKTQCCAGKNGCGKGDVNYRLGETEREQSFPSKKAKLFRDGQESDAFPVGEHPSNCARPSKSGDGIVSVSEVPDVADAIEDLLEQSSKIQDQKSPERISEKTLFTSSEQYHSGIQSVTGLSRLWVNRCGLPAKIVTSRTDNNPGRRFFGCPLYKKGRTDHCDYFDWFDEGVVDGWPKEALIRARDKIREKDKVINQLTTQLMELRLELEKHKVEISSEGSEDENNSAFYR